MCGTSVKWISIYGLNLIPLSISLHDLKGEVLYVSRSYLADLTKQGYDTSPIPERHIR